jgi:hypothetical protein
MGYLAFLATLLLAAIVTLALRMLGLRVRFEKIVAGIAVTLSWLPILLMHSLLVLMIEVAVWMLAVAVLDGAGLLHYVEVPNISGRHVVIGLTLLAVVFSLSTFLRAAKK